MKQYFVSYVIASNLAFTTSLIENSIVEIPKETDSSLIIFEIIQKISKSEHRFEDITILSIIAINNL